MIVLSAGLTSTRTVQQCLSPADISRYRQVFVDGLKSNDLQAVYYSAINHDLENEAEKKDVCKRLVTLYGDSKLNVSCVNKVFIVTR